MICLKLHFVFPGQECTVYRNGDEKIFMKNTVSREVKAHQKHPGLDVALCFEEE